MSRLLPFLLPLLATPALAHEGLHHHPHGIEFGWVTVVLLGSVIGGGAVLALIRRRK
jgi:hypothetical protein